MNYFTVNDPASPHWARLGARAQARSLSGTKAPLRYKSASYATSSLQLTSRIFGNMIANCLEVVLTNNRSVITQTARAAILFLICASERAASRPAGALSEYWLQPFPFSGGSHAGIPLPAYLNNQSSNSWAALAGRSE